MAEVDSNHINEMLCFAIYKAEQAFSRVYRLALEPLGLTYPQFLTMRLLWLEGELSVSDVSNRLGLDTGTVTPLLKRLVRLGFVRKARIAEDERRVQILLTDTGRALEARSNAVMLCVAGAAELDDTAVSEMLAQVTNLTANLNKNAKRGGAADRASSKRLQNTSELDEPQCLLGEKSMKAKAAKSA